MNTPDNDGHIFSEEAIRNLEELGHILRRIRARLIQEGKAKIIDGKIVFLEEDKNGQ